MLIVSGVGTLIVAYSIGYMYGDQKERRFFVYLNLFLFSMLLLVMSANFALLLAGWGLVGLSSYLLIGFWHERKAPVDAAKKAFVMNAIGDVGIAIVVFIMVRDLGTVQFQAVFDQAGARWAQGSETANWIAFLLLVAAVAKSAQIPLHTWLPDAMEGPTPVSALIHAATMVTAGVYLVARTHLLFENAPDIHDLVALIGVATLLMAGAIAVVQTDIKRIIAYSTMSQIGYMFAAVGVGAYSSGMDHLLTHAFFKALLFLGAGIVIHALSGEQDVRRMGGLHSALPRTTGLMWIGTIALIGFWPTSKDGILGGRLREGRNARDDRLGGRPDRGVLHGRLRGAAHAAHVLRPEVDVRRRPPPRHVARRGAGDDVLDGDGARRRRDPVGLPRHRVRRARSARGLAAVRGADDRRDRG